MTAETLAPPTTDDFFPGKDTLDLLETTVSSAKPRKNREETVELMSALIDKGLRPNLSNVYGNSPMLVSDLPASSSKEGGVIMGIDEAGRGPVLGPMTYGAAYWHPSATDNIPKGFNDSKQLSAETREKLFQGMMGNSEIGFVLRILNASEISRNMLQSPKPYNLNSMSHDAAIQMIQAVLDASVKIDTCFIDTVGIADHYQSHLDRVFQGRGITFVVEKKADAKYAQCSAASVVAKVARDHMIESWKFTEQPNFEAIGGLDYGSGYPSDPKCKKWIESNLIDKIFCFPDLVRFSWGPAKKAVEEGGVAVAWEDDEDEDDAAVKKQQDQMKAFLGGGAAPEKKKPRLAYFEKRKMSRVTKLVHN